MSAIPDAWKNDFASNDSRPAKRKVLRTCARCPTVISGGKKYCSPCAADSYEETVIANRAKYKALKK